MKGTRFKFVTALGACSLAAVLVLASLQASRLGFFARGLEGVDAQSEPYGITVSKFETSDAGGSRHALGLGFSGSLEGALRSSQPAFRKCRQHFQEGTGDARFQVKVSAKQERLRVVGILRGAQENAVHAACLRDTLEALPLAFLAKTPQADDGSYTLQVDISSGIHAR